LPRCQGQVLRVGAGGRGGVNGAAISEPSWPPSGTLNLMSDEAKTTDHDVVAWLRHQGNHGPDACIQERDWCAKATLAADEIERLRAEIVALKAKPEPFIFTGTLNHGPT
jgi:hypothetical protein